MSGSMSRPHTSSAWEGQEPKHFSVPLPGPDHEHPYGVRPRFSRSKNYFVAGIGRLVMAYALPDFNLVFSIHHELEVAAIDVHDETLIYAYTDWVVHVRDLVSGETCEIEGLHPQDFPLNLREAWYSISILKPELAHGQENGSVVKEEWRKEPLVLLWGSPVPRVEVWRLPHPGERGPNGDGILRKSTFFQRNIQAQNHRILCHAALGRTLVTGGIEYTIRVWDIITGGCEMVLLGHRGRVYSISLDRNQVYSSAYDGTIRIWNLQAAECLHILSNSNNPQWISPSYMVDLTPLGTLRLWDSVASAELYKLELPGLTAYSYCCQHDDRKLVTVSSRGDLEIRDVRSGKVLQHLSVVAGAEYEYVHCVGRLCIVLVIRNDKFFFEVWDFNVDDGPHEGEWEGQTYGKKI